jgi:phosphoadenosine phosphosulfate reductase
MGANMSDELTRQDSLARLQDQFETKHPKDILRWAVETYGDQLVVVTSFQPTGIVTLHMLNEIAGNTPIVTLDTGLLFPETYALMDELEARFNLNLNRARPELTVDQQSAQHGAKLWEREPDRCCNMRKTLPLREALTGYSAWISGLRRDQSASRANIPIISWDERNGMVKLNPFANWTEEMIWIYIRAHELPYNDLHDRGYPSIGCFPCTQAVAEGEDARSGRWSAHDKIECGIHVNLIGDEKNG